jgi:tRNA modification GTPase
VNKGDLPQALESNELARLSCGRRISWIAAKTGDGILQLKDKLRALLLDSEIEAPVVITNIRHRSALERGQTALRNSIAALEENYAAEFVAIDLNEAREALEEITGIIQNDDILERIFMNFCIGK